MHALRRAFGAAALCLAALPAALPAADEVGKRAEGIVTARSAAIVTIEVVLDYKRGERSGEVKVNTRGVIVADTGLILAPLEVLSPRMGQGPQPELKLQAIRVVVESDEKEWEAFVVLKDTLRGLTFLQLKDFKPADRKLQWVDFTKAAKAQTGEQLVTVLRLAKGYDYAPHFSVNRIVGEITKPRAAQLVDAAGPVGLPVFRLDGQLVGCHGVLASELAGDSSRHAVVFPADDLVNPIKQAREKAAEGEQKTE
ncbi:MAG: hypothetical protein JXQ29_00920 [Planctomycetes bacterium]|nr:hypothetical protein [Planctomycetota bacterium]